MKRRIDGGVENVAKIKICSNNILQSVRLSLFGRETHFTTLQSIMNAKLSQHWHCHENGLIKTTQTIPYNLYVSFKLASLFCGLRLILVYPNL